MLKIPIICGPTASGKTSLSVELFSHKSAEIISADSMQIYKGMDIGTASPSVEEQKKIKHNLIDIVSPDEYFSVGDFYRNTENILNRLSDSNIQPVITGGTGLYIKSLMNGFFDAPKADNDIRAILEKQEADSPGSLYQELEKVDKEAFGRIYPADMKRIIRALEVFRLTGESISSLQRKNTRKLGYDFFAIGIIRDRDVLNRRINARVELMLSEGLLDEAIKLRENGYGPGLSSMQSLGYLACFDYLEKKIDYDTLRYRIKKETRDFAKRQIKLFRRINGIKWFFAEDKKNVALYLRQKGVLSNG